MKVRVRWVDGRILEIREKGMLLMDLKCQRTSITQAVRMLCWAAPSMEMPFLAVQAFTSESTTVAYKPTGATVDFSKHGGVVMDLDEQSKMQATIYRPETSSRLGTTPSCPWGSPPQLGRDTPPTPPLPSRRGGAAEEAMMAALPPKAVASPEAPRTEATREDGARSRGRRLSQSSNACREKDTGGPPPKRLRLTSRAELEAQSRRKLAAEDDWLALWSTRLGIVNKQLLQRSLLSGSVLDMDSRQPRQAALSTLTDARMRKCWIRRSTSLD